MQPTHPKNKRFLFIWLFAGVVALGILLGAGGLTYAANQEEHDPFCASCHTQPESTFVQRSTDAQPVDLASYHTGQNTRCIDCHSGQGVTGRLQAEFLGAHNLLAWYSNTAVQPAHMNEPLPDSHCLKCHAEVTQKGYTPKNLVSIVYEGRQRQGEAHNNHWHELMARWQSTSSSAGNCTSCHFGHITDGNAASGFQTADTTRATCDACHRGIRRGRE
ncbi:MAG: NapC/NirT family cytochrome c [Caldilineaceae bacterium]